MEHANHLVDIVNQQGEPVGQKRRRDINKEVDIHHSVQTLLVTPDGQVVLTKILRRDDLPNIYADKLGLPVATIRRSNENADQAALRSLSRELFIDGAEVFHLGDKFLTLSDGRQTYLSGYYLMGMPPQTFSKTDIGGLVVLDPSQLHQDLAQTPECFAPTLVAFWEQFSDQLPLR